MPRASVNNKKMTNIALTNGEHVMGIRKNPEDETYGDTKLAGDAMEMPIGRYMAIYLKICIKFASPVVLIILIIVDWVHHGKNHHGLGHHSGESFPSIMEHLLTYASLIFLPIFAGWEIFKIYRKGEEKELLFKPTKEWFEVIHD